MTNRKILYGYKIQNGELTVIPQEADTIRRIVTLYLNGLSYQKISDILNHDAIPFSMEVPLWNMHKVKRLLENPRYTGTSGYPPILESDVFQAVQENIRQKTAQWTKQEKRPALGLKDHLRCACGGNLHRVAGTYRRKDTLYLKCGICGKQLTVLDNVLLTEVTRQIAKHDPHVERHYVASSEVVRLTNAVNRGLEHPDKPEEIVSLILQGISARYKSLPR